MRRLGQSVEVISFFVILITAYTGATVIKEETQVLS